MKTIRTFIAVDLPAAARAAWGGVAQQLAAQLPSTAVRWVKPERMHLTLRFLGDTAVSQLPMLADGLDQMAQQFAPFSLRLSHLGCFPNERRPHVVWVGLQGDTEALAALKKGVDAALVPLGWEAETRPFQAHLTVGRVKDARQLAGVQWGMAVEEVEVPVTAV
ncbi:MAG: RNA 2',3'-cyclic phosphodiesterase, partial [Anaerolineales bacterium]|nr:RNA 2',3'-cyclic phosphodiesterase [Anaerolineales bacterium]